MPIIFDKLSMELIIVTHPENCKYTPFEAYLRAISTS